jgi:hypothetical protein
LSFAEKLEITPSHDINKLKKLINLENKLPLNAKWTYSKTGNQSEK